MLIINRCYLFPKKKNRHKINIKVNSTSVLLISRSNFALGWHLVGTMPEETSPSAKPQSLKRSLADCQYRTSSQHHESRLSHCNYRSGKENSDHSTTFFLVLNQKITRTNAITKLHIGAIGCVTITSLLVLSNINFNRILTIRLRKE